MLRIPRTEWEPPAEPGRSLDIPRVTGPLETIFNYAGAGIAYCRTEGYLIDCNDAFCRMLQRDRAWLREHTFKDITHPDDHALEQPLFEEMIARQRDSYRIEKRYLTGNQQVIWVDISVSVVRDSTGAPEIFIGVILDITARRHAEAQLKVFRDAFRSTGQAMLLTDAAKRIVEVNAAFERVTGYSRGEVLGLNPAFLSSGKTPPALIAEMWRSIEEHGSWEGEVWDRRKSGEVYPKQLAVSRIRNEQGDATHYLGCFSDVSALKGAERDSSFLANFDPLTGLPNRYSLHDRLALALNEARLRGEALALICVDIDDFAAVNDHYGQATGNRCLMALSERMRARCRGSDLVARLGSDSFALVLTGLHHEAPIEQMANAVREKIGAVDLLPGQDIPLKLAAGLAIFPRDGDDVETLMRHAEIARHQAKALGGNRLLRYVPGMQRSAEERQRIEDALQSAVAEGQLQIHYQPKISARSGECLGFEAILRWQHPELGLISPEVFLPMAARRPSTRTIGFWALDAVCRQMAAWRDSGLGCWPVSLNITPGQLEDMRLIQYLCELLDRYNLPAEQLELEIRESAAMATPETTILLLRGLRELGVRLAIDDFGSGYSTLKDLRRLPVHVLKIDRSFVRDIGDDQGAELMLGATVDLAHRLGFTVVAQGVDRDDQRAFLQARGCDQMQGYLFAPARPPAAAILPFHPAQACSGAMADTHGVQ